MPNTNQNKGNPVALLPLLLFLALFIGTGVITKNFENMPVYIALGIAIFIGLLMNRKVTFQKKLDHFCEGAGEPNIILMCFIFLLAGAFGEVAKEMGPLNQQLI